MTEDLTPIDEIIIPSRNYSPNKDYLPEINGPTIRDFEDTIARVDVANSQYTQLDPILRTMLGYTDRFNQILSEHFITKIQEGIHLGEVNITQQDFDKFLSGGVTETGYIIDKDGKATSNQGWQLGQDHMYEEEYGDTFNTAFKQFIMEKQARTSYEDSLLEPAEYVRRTNDPELTKDFVDAILRSNSFAEVDGPNHPEWRQFFDWDTNSELASIEAEEQMIAVKADIDAGNTTISSDQFKELYNGQISKNGRLLDAQGNETNLTPYDFWSFSLQEMSSEAFQSRSEQVFNGAFNNAFIRYKNALIAKYMPEQIAPDSQDQSQQTSEQKIEQGPLNDEDRSRYDSNLAEYQLARDELVQHAIDSLRRLGFKDRALELSDENTRMKQTEIEQGIIFRRLPEFLAYEHLSKTEHMDGVVQDDDSGYSPGEQVALHIDGKVYDNWTFLGIVEQTGAALVGSVNLQGRRTWKSHDLDDLIKIDSPEQI
jgi:hypothetical protein